MTCCLPHFLVPKALLLLLPCLCYLVSFQVILLLQISCAVDGKIAMNYVEPWSTTSSELEDSSDFILLLPACRQSVWCDCLKCPWAQWFQKAFVLIYQIWQDPWVRASSASTCCTKNMFGNWKCTIFPSPKNMWSLLLHKEGVCVGLTVLLLNVFSLNTWALRTYVHGFLSYL